MCSFYFSYLAGNRYNSKGFWCCNFVLEDSKSTIFDAWLQLYKKKWCTIVIGGVHQTHQPDETKPTQPNPT